LVSEGDFRFLEYVETPDEANTILAAEHEKFLKKLGAA